MLGIGTNVPGAKLNVRGPDNNTLLKLERNSVSGSGLDITYRGANDGYEIKSNDQGGISLEASGNHELRFETNGQERMHIEGNGNISVGNTGSSPSTTMDISGSLTVQEDAQNNGGDVFFKNLPSGYNYNYQAVMIDTTNGKLYRMTSHDGYGGYPGDGSVWTENASSIYYNSGDVGVGTSNPQSTFHVNGPGDAVTITTDYKLTMQHYNSNYGADSTRPFLKKDWLATPSYGDVLYIGSTGDRSNTNQTAMLFSQNAGIMFGSGHDSGNNITEKWMNVNKSNVRIFSSTSHIGGFDGYQNLIVNNGTPYSTPQSLKGGMFVNAQYPYYGYASGGTAKAHSYYDESNGNKFLKWNVAGNDKMKLDQNGNLSLEGNLSIGGSSNGYIFPTNRGTDGQVLTMGSTPGQLEWTNPGSGGNGGSASNIDDLGDAHGKESIYMGHIPSSPYLDSSGSINTQQNTTLGIESMKNI